TVTGLLGSVVVEPAEDEPLVLGIESLQRLVGMRDHHVAFEQHRSLFELRFGLCALADLVAFAAHVFCCPTQPSQPRVDAVDMGLFTGDFGTPEARFRHAALLARDIVVGGLVGIRYARRLYTVHVASGAVCGEHHRHRRHPRHACAKMGSVSRIVSGKAGGTKLRVPKKGTRPTTELVREALCTSLAVDGDLDGTRVLDLYSGSGGLGLEALSRGAASVLFVEADRTAAEVLRGNIAAVGLGGVVRQRRVLDVLRAGSGEPVELVLVDPPYALDE